MDKWEHMEHNAILNEREIDPNDDLSDIRNLGF